MNLTKQQQTIIDTIQQPDCTLLAICAVSGAGKTSTLIAISEALPIKHGLYLAFNKSIADEAKTKFPSKVECRTLHSLAYAFIISGTNRKISDLIPDKIIEPKLKTKEKYEVITLLNEFFASASLDIEEFLAGNPLLPYCFKYLHQMEDGVIDSTFGFILKRFQVLVHLNLIKLPHYDFLALDEAGDSTACVLDLFNHIPATKKVMVGDNRQNIYGFMHTVNGFEELASHAIELPLSQSFRVSEAIATKVEAFARKHIDKHMEFKGVPISNYTIKSHAYLSRTNAYLIDRMIQLHQTQTKYTLLRPLDSIFSLPLTIANLDNPKWSKPAEHLHIISASDTYNEDPELQSKYKSKFAYLRSYFLHDVQIQTALALISKYGSKKIIDTYFTAKTMNKPRQPITLATAFSSKGSEYDSVYIEDDLNYAVESFLESPSEDLTVLYLFYVACTRARYSLQNATALSL